MPRIVVTGGAGFIGSHVARRLLAEGHEVTVLDDLSTGRVQNVPEGARFVEVDLADESDSRAFDGLEADAVFHLAAQSSGEASFLDPRADLGSHVVATFRLLEWCRRRRIPRFLYASSMSVYGDPDRLPVAEDEPLRPRTFYAAGKAAAEAYVELARNLGLATTVLRMFSVYGPGQNLANKLQGMASIYLSYVLEGVPVVVKGSPDRFRDLVYIDDVVEAWVSAFKSPVAVGKTYNVGSGRRTTVRELLEGLKKACQAGDHPIEFREGTPGDQFGLVADVRRIGSDLGWRPTVEIEEGLSRMADFERRRLGLAR